MTDNERKEKQAPEGAAEGPSPEGMTEDELRAALEEQFRQQKVPDLLMQYMVSLSSLAYIKMGITEDTRDVRDLEQARLAIDSFKALLDSVGDRLGDQDQQALAGALASMQMTFAKASAEGGPGEEPSAEDDEQQGDDPSSRLWVPGKE